MTEKENQGSDSPKHENGHDGNKAPPEPPKVAPGPHEPPRPPQTRPVA